MSGSESETHRLAGLVKSDVAAREILAISERKLWEMTNAGLVPHVRLGRCLRYSPAALQAWMENQSQGGVGNG